MTRNPAGKEGGSRFLGQGDDMAVSCGVGKTQSMRVLWSWLKTGFFRGGQGGGTKPGKIVWDLTGRGVVLNAKPRLELMGFHYL